MRLLWVDAGAGVAGDMLLAALIDAGADLSKVQDSVDTVLAGLVRFELSEVTRAGLRAAQVQVHLTADAPQPHRQWRALRELITSAPLDPRVREQVYAVFHALAGAEARVHGLAEDDVHFHEVGAWDSIADVVGVVAAWSDLGCPDIIVSPIALGSGTVVTEHGVLPVPVPAVLELSRGHAVLAGGTGECATPTGVALLTTLASAAGPLPAMVIGGSGVGAGSRDTPERPNVVRVVLGTAAEDRKPAPGQPMTAIETTVDDLDPRVWPTVIDDLLAAGAADAWLTPVLMKKGRPGHVLTVLAAPADAPQLRRLVLERTSALGVRQWEIEREILDRSWVTVEVGGRSVRIKVAARDGVVVHATAEFDDALTVSTATGRPVRAILEAAQAAYHQSFGPRNAEL